MSSIQLAPASEERTAAFIGVSIKPGPDCVDADLVLGELLGEDLRQHPDAGLADGVIGDAFERQGGADGGDVHDGAAVAARDHGAGRRRGW